MPHKPTLSITLPRSFSFHYTEAPIPETPAEQQQEMDQELPVPQAPPRTLFKVRRRKLDAAPRSNILSEMHSDALPTFEMTEAADRSSPVSNPPDVDPDLLVPTNSHLAGLAPPKTPVDQITEYTLDNKRTDWLASTQDCYNGPISPWSSLSDSSLSSHDSDDYFPVLTAGGDIHSPDSETNDPFGSALTSPVINSNSPSAKRLKVRKNIKWTPAMDKHIWETYLKYQELPAMTPFKTLPGTVPPLGVCGRVARQAKNSWKGGRPDELDAAGSASDHANTWSHWPSSESGTRKRFRKLCKSQNSMSAHYQRLIMERSPSPFESSSPRSRSDAQPSSYQGSDATVVPQSSDTVLQQPINLSSDIADPFDSSHSFATYRRGHMRARSQAHKKTQSLQIALGGRPDFMSHARQHSMGVGPSSSTFPRSETAPQLKSPLELHAPMPTNRSLKRRFGILDSSPANINRLESLFSETGVSARPSPTRHHDRTVSLGAVRSTSRRMSLSFDEPSEASAQTPHPVRQFSSMRVRPTTLDSGRLGSPFTMQPSNDHFNTFPRRMQPPSSPAAFQPNFSLEGRFRELAAQSAAARRQ